MNRYENFVACHKISGKLATDLARLLDDPLFAVNPKNGSYGIAEARERAYGCFCRACQDAGIPLPPLETELIDCYLSRSVLDKDIAKSSELAKKVTKKVKVKDRSLEANTCRAIAVLLSSFPNVINFSSIDGKSLIALANRCRIQLGLEPIRPEYNVAPNNQFAPPRPVKALVVDDDIGEILNTAVALAGWPDLEVAWLHQKSKLGWSPSQDQTDIEVAELAQAIIASACDIVFMDEGLNNLKGHSVVAKVRSQTGQIIFIASTGGSDDELMRAGCVASARKGEKAAQALRAAFSYLS